MKRSIIFILLFVGCASVVADGSGPSPPTKWWKIRDGVTGDSSDITTALQASLDRVATTTGILALDSGVYLLTDSIVVPEGVTLIGNKATLWFQLEDAERAICLLSNSTIQGFAIDVDSVGPITGHGAYGAPISIGEFTPGVGYHNISISDMTIEGERRDGNGIAIFGDCYNIAIDNIYFPNSANMGRAIMPHWGNTAFDTVADTGSTTHPHDISISNIQIDTLSWSSNAAIFLSGSYNIDIQNVFMLKVKTAIKVYAGDAGFRYAADLDTALIEGQGIRISNMYAQHCTGIAFSIEGVAAGLNASDSSWNLPVELMNSTFEGNGSATNGAVLNYSQDAKINNCSFSGFVNGLAVLVNVKRLKISNSRFTGNQVNGLYISNGTGPPEDVLIENCYIADNGKGGPVSFDNGIYIDEAYRITVSGCKIGLESGEGVVYGIRVFNQGRDHALINNHVFDLYDSTASKAFSIVGDDSTVVVFWGNTVAAALTLQNPYVRYDTVGFKSYITADSGLAVKHGATSAGYVDFYEDSDNGSNRVRIIGPASTANITLTWPSTDGDAGDVMQSDGSGVMSWQPDAGAGGALTYFTESDDNDTSVFVATGPNTTVGFNDLLTMQGNDITNVRKITLDSIRALSGVPVEFVSQVRMNSALNMEAQIFLNNNDISGADKITSDTGIFTQINISGDEITDFAGANLSVTAGVLNSSGSTDSALVAQYAHVSDSLALAVLHDGSQALTGDWAAGDFDITGLNHITGDTISVSYAAVQAELNLLNGATSAGYINFIEDSDNGTNAVKLIGPASTGDITLTLPSSDGDNGQQLTTDGSGVMSWQAAAVGLVAADIIMDTIAAPTFSTVQQMQNVFHSVGWTTGGAFTDSTDGAGDIDSLHIAAGTGLIRTSDIAADTNTIFFFDWGDTIIEIPADTTLFIGVKYNAGTPVVFQTTADKTLLDHQQNFELGTVTNETGLLHLTFNPHAIGDHATLMIERTQGTMGIQRDNDLGGLILGEKETRHLTVTAGTLFSKLNSFSISAIDLFVSGSMDRYYRAAGSGFTKEAAITQWNNTQWDDGDGGLATLANNKYAVQWFYLELDGALISMYGRATHNSLSLAEGESPPSTLPLRLTVNQAKLIGRILFQESSATAAEIQTVFTTAFPATAAEDHGNLAGLSGDDHTQYLLRSQFPDSVVKIIEDSIATMSLDSAFVGVSPVKAAVFGVTTTKPGYIMQEPDAHFGDADDGMIEIGNAIIALGARDTLYNSDSLDIGGSMIFRQTVEPDGLFEFAFYENGGDLRFVIPKSGVGLGTWNARSMFIAGPERMIDSVVRFDFWGFSKIDANTDATGADLGIQDDLEVMGKAYLDTIDNITAAPVEVLADIAMNSNDITGVDSADVDKYTDGSIDLPDVANTILSAMGDSARDAAADTAAILRGEMPDSGFMALDLNDDGSFTDTIQPVHLQEGANITFTVAGDTLTIAGPAGGGTADSMGVDTNGDGTVDAYLYSTTAGAFHLKKGTGVVLTVDTDTVEVAVTTDIANHTLDSAETMVLWRDTVATTKETILKIVSDSASLDTAVVANLLRMPAVADPTTAVSGEIAVDSDDAALELYDGSRSVLMPMHRTVGLEIWDPELITDTMPLFYVDSVLYPGGIEVIRIELQTSVDGAYSLIFPYYTAADPPVLSDYIDTLVVGGSDQRVASTTFENSTIGVGEFIYYLTPVTDIDWIRFTVTFYAKDFD